MASDVQFCTCGIAAPHTHHPPCADAAANTAQCCPRPARLYVLCISRALPTGTTALYCSPTHQPGRLSSGRTSSQALRVPSHFRRCTGTGAAIIGVVNGQGIRDPRYWILDDTARRPSPRDALCLGQRYPETSHRYGRLREGCPP